MTTQSTQTADNSNANSSTVVTSGPLQELVGEGKKFKTVDDLAVGKKQSDAFIQKLEAENRELRALGEQAIRDKELAERRAAFVERVTGDDDTSTQVTNPDTNRQQSTNNQSAGLTEDDVFKLMEQAKTTDRQNANLASVDAALVKELGAEAKNFIAQKAVELGVSTEYLITTAKASPAAFFNMVGFQTNSSRNSSLTSTVQGVTISNGSNGAQTRDQKYYDTLKTTMGAWKFVNDKALQIQLHRDMQSLGDRFFD